MRAYATGYMALDEKPCPACYLEHTSEPSALITEEIRVKLRARQSLLNATLAKGAIHGKRVWLFADTPYYIVNEIGRLHLLADPTRAFDVAAFTHLRRMGAAPLSRRRRVGARPGPEDGRRRARRRGWRGD
jgi:hypothetical protein